MYLRIVFSALFVLFISEFSLSAQVSDSLVYEIEEAKITQDFSCYYNSIDLLDREYVNLKLFPLLDSTSQLFDVLPSDKQDSFLFRKVLMYHGFRIKYNTGDLNKSLYFYLRAYEHVNDKNNLDNLCWYTEKYISGIYARLNEYDKGIYFAKKVEKYLRSKGDSGKLARLYSDMGDLYYWKKQVSIAMNYYNEGLKLGAKAKDVKAISGNALSMARQYLRVNDLANFKKTYAIAKAEIDKLKDIKDQHERLAEFEGLLGDFYSKQKLFAKAEDQYTKCVNLLRKGYNNIKVREIAKYYLKLARNAYANLDESSTNKYIDKGLKWLIPDYNFSGLPKLYQISNENTFMDLLELKARLYSQKDENEYEKLDTALQAVNLALTASQLLDQNILLNESRFVSATYNKNLLSKGVEIAYRLWIQTNEVKYYTTVRKYLSSSKYVLLNEKKRMQKALEGVSNKEKEEVFMLEKELLNTVDLRESHKTNHDSLYDRIIELTDTINLQYAKLTYEESVILEAPYVEYFKGEKDYYSIDNFSGTPFRKIGSSQYIDSLILSVRVSLQNPDSLILTDQLKVLSELLFPQVDGNVEEVVVIPDGQLLLIPFEVLLHDGKSILHQLKMRYQYSYDWGMEDEAQIKKIACLSPNYDEITDSSYDFISTPLYFREEELDAISNSGFSKIEMIEEVAIETVKELESKFEALHFLGHAYYEGDSSFMVVQENGKLKKISNSHLELLNPTYKLVTLSSCESGLGKYIKGEGVRSLAYSFLVGNTSNVVQSLWKVNDKSTSKIMSYFYKNLSAGDPIPTALHKAKLDFIANASPTEKHPYYWSGFVCVGTEPFVIQNDRLSPILVFLIAFAIFLIIFWKRKTKT